MDLESVSHNVPRTSALRSRVASLRIIFPSNRLAAADYLIGSVILVVVFALCFHSDLWRIGLASLNFLYGSPLAFYDNSKAVWLSWGFDGPATSYPPSVYAIYAIWLYPFELLGAITGPDQFSIFLTYWLKALTVVLFFASGVVFHQICREYVRDAGTARFFTAAWLTAPLALYSLFIFSQVDIFYVVPSLLGMLLFLRDRPVAASLLFSVAITFKYFPAFVFVPVLLLNEKRLLRVSLCAVIFALPTVLVQLLYGHSVAFIQDVKHHFALDKVFAVGADTGLWRIYGLFLSFSALCGVAYLTEAAAVSRARMTAYFWLVGALLPFVFIAWHPQWTLSFVPAVVLTTMLSGQAERFLTLDLIGTFFFLASSVLAYPGDAGEGLLRGYFLLDFQFANPYPMSRLFEWFGENLSVGVFASCFVGYLLIQMIMKYSVLVHGIQPPMTATPSYDSIRVRFYVGLGLFLVPAAVCIFIPRSA